MGFPLFRFTLDNAIEGTLEIKEPEGWDNGTLKLERNEDYHSLVEYYDQPLLFDDAQAYDLLLSAILPGGMAYIKNIEYTQGIDAIITGTIAISEDEGATFETMFESVLDIPTVKETDFYKLELGAKRDDFWSKFINRKSIPIDLQATVDMDGNVRDAVDSFVLPLPIQKMRNISTYNGTESIGTGSFTGVDAVEKYAQIGFAATRTEIKDSFQILFAEIAAGDLLTDLINIIEVKENGNISVTAVGTVRFEATASVDIDQVDFTLYVRKNSDSPIVIYNNSIGSLASTSIDETMDINAVIPEVITGIELGDLIYCYVRFQIQLSTTGNVQPLFELIDTTIEFTQDSFTEETETDAFLLRDAAESIISKLVGADDVILSDYLNTGCGEPYAIMKGLHVRGYSFADKPFAMSFDQWWNGANPILNLGLGYELGGSPETNKIRIEQKSYFYNPTPSLNLDLVNNIERSYDIDKIIKSIEIGYNKWSAESASGVDDPQTKRTWRTRFATVGKDEKVLSLFIAASLAIEQTRRNRAELGKDWRLDEDIMIIALVQGSPLWQPEYDENFDSITGLLNSDARYNIRLSCRHNFERWKNYFNGCLQIPAGEEFIFASGEGNYDMTTRLDSSDCEATGDSPEPTFDEKGDIEVTDNFLWIPIVYEFEHPLTYAQYKTIRDNRNNAIGVSRGNSGHKACFIMNLDYKPTRGLGTFTVILGENDPL